jgi:hypothetical protein
MLLSLSFFSLFFLPQKRELHENSIKKLQKLTQLPSLSNSTTFLEHRVALYQDFSNRIYPQMQEHTYREFVYAE